MAVELVRTDDEPDLEDLLPRGKGFRWRGVRWELPGEVDIPDVVRALQITDMIDQAQDQSDVAAALQELHDIVGECFDRVPANHGRDGNGKVERDEDGHVTVPRFGEEGLMMVFGWMVGGMDGQDLRAAVRELVAEEQQQPTDASEEPDPTKPRRGSGTRAKPGSAGPSRKRSRAAS